MLDPKQLKVGSVVRMEGKVTKIHDKTVVLDIYDRDAVVIFKDVIQHAELVSTPVTFSAEQIAAIKERLNHFPPGAPSWNQSCLDVETWLEAHEDKSRLE